MRPELDQKFVTLVGPTGEITRIVRRDTLKSPDELVEEADADWQSHNVTIGERVLVSAVVDNLSERAQELARTIETSLEDIEAIKARIKLDYEELQDCLKCAEDILRMVGKSA